MDEQAIMVCGYRGTGKDYLAAQLSNDPIPFNWKVYGHDDAEFIDIGVPRVRVSFADELKRQVMEAEGIEPGTYSEELKSTVIRDGLTFRDILIDVATKKRAEVPTYWAEYAIKRFLESHGEGTPFIVTDWRFPNELEYLRSIQISPITIRVYCPTVPRVDTESETALDDVLTDFVLVRGGVGGQMMAQFPQYAGYVELDVV